METAPKKAQPTVTAIAVSVQRASFSNGQGKLSARAAALAGVEIRHATMEIAVIVQIVHPVSTNPTLAKQLA